VPGRSPTVIRAAEENDAASLADLATQLGYPTGGPAMAERLRAIRPAGEVLVAERDGRVVAWIYVAELPSILSGPRADILGFIVDEGCRGQGIGRELLAAAEAWARERGLATVVVKSAIHRDRTHDFYRRAGYEDVKQQRVFRKSV